MIELFLESANLSTMSSIHKAREYGAEASEVPLNFGRNYYALRYRFLPEFGGCHAVTVSVTIDSPTVVISQFCIFCELQTSEGCREKPVGSRRGTGGYVRCIHPPSKRPHEGNMTSLWVDGDGGFWMELKNIERGRQIRKYMQAGPSNLDFLGTSAIHSKSKIGLPLRRRRRIQACLYGGPPSP